MRIKTKGENLFLRVSTGHFATSHSHTNYYIDVTEQKMSLTEAEAVAEVLLHNYKNTVIDTILCLDGMEVVGACLARILTRNDFMSVNANQNIFVVTPEHTTGSQLLFRDNTAPMIQGKSVLVLAASVTTGFTAASAVEAIRYYGGRAVGIGAIFATLGGINDIDIISVFNPNDLPDYESYEANDCPMCKAGERIDALVNSFGYSKL